MSIYVIYLLRSRSRSFHGPFHTASRHAAVRYGIYNVNERIRLCYGSSYGLTYESQEGSFTKAVLTIPLHFAEVDEHV